jgi:hypothetical protein
MVARLFHGQRVPPAMRGGGHQEHHTEEGKEGGPLWDLTAPGVDRNDGSPRLRWRKRKEASCGAGELDCGYCVTGSGGLHAKEHDVRTAEFKNRRTRRLQWRSGIALTGR